MTAKAKPKPTPAERAAVYAKRSHAAKPEPEPAGAIAAPPADSTPARYAWKVDRWANHNLVVLVTPPQTQAQMREHYPDAAGIHPLED